MRFFVCVDCSPINQSRIGLQTKPINPMMKPIIATAILCFVISLGGVFAYKYDGHDGDEDTNSEWGSGYYGHDYGRGSDCDLMVQVGTNEPFSISYFPPAQQRTSASAAYQIRRRGDYRLRIPPEQCIWEFGTGGDDCMLEFHSHYFKRGDIDCEEQYLLIGDENDEMRICGFAKPPRHFNSSGKKLFLGHYRRNGYHRTVPSQLSGLVRCVNRPPACNPPPNPSCTLSAPFSTSRPDSTGFLSITFFQGANPTVNPFPFDMQIPCDKQNGCTVQARACSRAISAGDCTVEGSAENPFPDGQGVVCQTKSATCPLPGPCEGSGFVGTESGGNGYEPLCVATPNQKCSWTVAFCVGPPE